MKIEVEVYVSGEQSRLILSVNRVSKGGVVNMFGQGDVQSGDYSGIPIYRLSSE